MVRGVGFEPTQAYAIGDPTPRGPEPDPFDLARAPPHQNKTNTKGNKG